MRLLRGEVMQVGADTLTIRDTLMRSNECELPAAAERLATNGSPQVPALTRGAYVEAIVEQIDIAGQSNARCVIRTLYVRAPRAPVAATSNRSTSFLDNLFPRGNLVYTGTVQGISDGRLELRSRRGVTTEFAVREDTTFSTGGKVVTRDELAPQTVVQVRAGRTFRGDLEVYQITWGGILPGQ